MKSFVLSALALSMLSACATPETRTAVDASRYLFDLDVSVNSELARFDPNVSKGSGSGAARGAGMGFGACILGPLEGSGGGDPAGALFVIAAGILISPACALVGSVVGSGMAETVEDVAARTAVLNDAASELDYPGALATLLSRDLKTGSIYKIHQSSDEPVLPLPGAATPTPETSDILTRISSDEFKGPFGSLAMMRALASQSKRPEDTALATPDPAVISPEVTLTEPNSSIRIHIDNYGLAGGGVDPKMPLQMTASLCVTEYQTGSALVSRSFLVSSKARKLEDWAELGQDGLETETLALVRRISGQVQAAMGRQVRLNHKTSCGDA